MGQLRLESGKNTRKLDMGTQRPPNPTLGLYDHSIFVPSLGILVCLKKIFFFPLSALNSSAKKKPKTKKGVGRGSGTIQSQGQILFWKALLSTLVGPEYIASPVFTV